MPLSRSSEELMEEAKARGVSPALFFAERAVEVAVSSRQRIDDHEARCDERSASASLALQKLDTDMRERMADLRRELGEGVREIRTGQKALYDRTFQMVLAVAAGLAAALVATVTIIGG